MIGKGMTLTEEQTDLLVDIIRMMADAGTDNMTATIDVRSKENQEENMLLKVYINFL